MTTCLGVSCLPCCQGSGFAPRMLRLQQVSDRSSPLSAAGQL